MYWGSGGCHGGDMKRQKGRASESLVGGGVQENVPNVDRTRDRKLEHIK